MAAAWLINAAVAELVVRRGARVPVPVRITRITRLTRLTRLTR